MRRLIAPAHPVVRTALAMLLKTVQDFVVVGEGGLHSPGQKPHATLAGFPPRDNRVRIEWPPRSG